MNADADTETNKKSIGTGTDPQREAIVNCSDWREAVLWIRNGFNADPDPANYLNADPDSGSQTNAAMRIRIWILVRL
jgi:hypothetical protein